MEQNNRISRTIEEGKASLGIEFGSTRIKAVLIGEDFLPIATGSHNWENQLENGIWTYSTKNIWNGLQKAYESLVLEVKNKYNVPVKKLASFGVSAMMHGYLALDEKDQILVPFRTWRNTITEEAAVKLTEALQFNIPQRWSIAHFYQALLNRESHVMQVHSLTTLAGYVHWKLTGQKVAGVGEASGMFPIDSHTGSYNRTMTEIFDRLAKAEGFQKPILELLPRVLPAGAAAGMLTAEGAALLDLTGHLQPGVPMCPPEGDAGTGMVATNSVQVKTGNVSAGTSIFLMVVLEKALSRVYPEIDMVTTPAGAPVAMVHANNCTSDIDSWVQMFEEVLTLFGTSVDKTALYTGLYNEAMKGEPDGGGLVSFNNLSGEPITGLEEGRPLFCRLPDKKMKLSNVMRTLLYATMATLRCGMDILTEQEHVQLDRLLGHGGLFKIPDVAQQIMASALQVPLSVMEAAGEGGPWGMALLGAYMIHHNEGESLGEFLDYRVFAGTEVYTLAPDEGQAKGFDQYMLRYKALLPVEALAGRQLKEI